MKTVVVLGCHRSATSLVAKGLVAAGVHMGDKLLGPNRFNPWGHWEDREFIRHNDRLLLAAGGSWRHPPSSEQMRAAIAAHAHDTAHLLERKADRADKLGVSAWGWKDPRTILTWPAYEPLLEDPILVVIKRDVECVAESLHHRDNLSLEQTRELTRIYMSRLEEIARGNHH